ncbi:efflux RND transporter periplasmic adaptor subunit [Thalassomonas viridans]|uniref:Efflux RND transporter periplasmic adaptor subunit n=1 Tax=Thalassomonas viridans TaxID=137584 RepID=A0AAE9Z7A4_9GAMM|nr:efflux RND transporter periplasmic adaptor subunit [Thalassomonas viridans]WDE06437.1 efflux RND transporter periplasmic adaptor subunit [Thalassomonas viridans]
MRRRPYLHRLAFTTIAAMLLMPLTLAPQGFPPASVNVVPAKITALSPVAWVSGTVVSPNNSQIAAEVSGRLVTLAGLGALVRKGDIIARIDDSQLLLQQQQDLAVIESAKAKLAFLQSEVERKKTLAKINLSAITDLDENISQRDIARGELTVAESKLAQTRQNLAFTRLKAPFNGLVVERLSNLGEYVKDGTAIVRLVETENIEASVFAPLTAYRYLQKAENLAVESPLGTGMAAVKSLIPVADRRSHLMEVRLDMSAFDWPIGLDIKAAVAYGESKAVLAVPRDALVLRREGSSIFRINGENHAEQIPVEIGIGAGNLVEVIGDISEGDNIVIRGAERLTPGQAVTINPDNQDLISGQ